MIIREINTEGKGNWKQQQNKTKNRELEKLKKTEKNER